MTLFFNVSVNDFESLGILHEVSEAIQHPQGLMNDVAEIVYEAISDAFEKEQTPEGAPWEKLQESTIEQRLRKRQTPIKILQATKRGERGIEVISEPNKVTVEYGSNGSEYMRYHMTGTRKMPQRRFIPTVEFIERNPKIRKSVEKFINSKFRIR